MYLLVELRILQLQSCCITHVAWIGSTTTVFACTTAPLMSSLVAKIGARTMIIVAAVSLILGQTLTSLATEIWYPFLTYSTLVGISVAIVYAVSWGG